MRDTQRDRDRERTYLAVAVAVPLRPPAMLLFVHTL